MDITFIIDSSFCESDSKWQRLLNFVRTLVSYFNVSPSGGRIALIPYGSDAKVSLRFDTLTGNLLNGEEVNRIVGNLECQGGSRRIDKALELADKEVLIPSAGMRDVSRPVLVITTGKQTTHQGVYTPLDIASSRLQDKGAAVFVLGIGKDVDPSELKQIASGPNNVFTVGSVEDLDTKANEAKKGICVLALPTPTLTVGPTTPQICPIAMDTTFVIDSSLCDIESNWNRLLYFVQTLVNYFNVSPSGGRVAFVPYGTNASVVLKFNTLTGNNLNGAEVKKRLDGLRCQGSFRRIDKALDLVDKEVLTPAGGLRDLSRVVFVITTGKQTADQGVYLPLEIASSRLQSKGAAVFVLGIGEDVDASELHEIASSPNNVFRVESFEDLDDRVPTIRRGICKLVPTSSTPTPTTTPRVGPCKVSADVAFIVDSSGSIGRRKWPLVLAFLKKVINEFNVGPDGTHVAVVVYSTNAKLEFPFNVVSGYEITAEEYGKRIDRIRYQRGFTYIDKALKLANEQVFVISAGMRPGVPKIAIVITDGEQTTTGGYTPLNEASQGIKDKGIAVYSLGIGKRVDSVQLRQIASSDSNVFTSAGFDDLVQVVKPIVKESCPKPTPPPTPGAICPIPMDTTFIIDSSVCDSDSDWNRLLYFIQALVTHFHVSPSGGRIALIPFSTGAKAALKFNTLTGSLLNGEEVNKRVGKLECQGGSRRVDKALDLADNEVLIPAAGMRDVSRPVLVILAGKQTTDQGAYTPLDEASYRLRTKGAPVFVLGIGNDTNTTELNQIASGPDNVFRVDSFKDLDVKAPQAKTGICVLVPPTTPMPTEFFCKAVADVAFIVDSSGSIGRRNWVKMLQFLKDMVKAFDVGPQKTHIAVVAYSTNANVEFRFNRLMGSAVSEEGYYGLIDRIRFQRGYTFIDKALKLANEQIFSTNFGMRPALPQIAIVITDGEQTIYRGDYTPLPEASQGLKDKNVILYSLGIGNNINQGQLNAIASSKNNVFTAASFSDLTAVVQTIVRNSCPVLPTTLVPTDR